MGLNKDLSGFLGIVQNLQGLRIYGCQGKY